MGRRDSRKTGELVAVVELGSTAVRFLLARTTPGGAYHVLAQERVQTRLGGGALGTLPTKAIDGTRRAVRRFFARYSSKARGPRVIAVATSAVRDARNRDRLLDPLRVQEGIDVQVLSARDEARLGVSTVLASLPFENGAVADLGGASLQLSRVRGRKIVFSASVPLGAVRTTRRFLRHDPPRPRELRSLRTEIRGQLLSVLPPAARGEVIAGLGGIVRTLASIHIRARGGKRKQRHGLTLRQSDVTAIRERLERLPPRKRRKIRGLPPQRADIILAGAIAIEELMILGGYLRLVVCMRGVRDGVLLRDLQRSAPR